jgi:hypothetical protein
MATRSIATSQSTHLANLKFRGLVDSLAIDIWNWTTNMLVPIGLRGSLRALEFLSTDEIESRLRRFGFFIKHAETTCIFITSEDTHVEKIRKDLEYLGNQKFNNPLKYNALTMRIEKAKKQFVGKSSLADQSDCCAECRFPKSCQFVICIDRSTASNECSLCRKKYIDIIEWFDREEFMATTRYFQEFTDNTWTNDKFNLNIWRRLFQFTVHAQVYDPHVSWAIRDPDPKKLHEVNYQQDYIDGVKWICASFVETPCRMVMTIRRVITFFGEISYSQIRESVGINTESRRSDEELLKLAGEKFRNRCGIHNIESEHGIRVELQLNLYGHRQSPDTRMRHNRYVSTDQATVVIDRGVSTMPQAGRRGFTDIILLRPAARRFIAAGIPFKPTRSSVAS